MRHRSGGLSSLYHREFGFRSQFHDSRHRLDRAANPVKPTVRTPIGASPGFTAPFSRLANTSYACRVARLSSDSGGVWAVHSDARYFPVPLLAGRRQPSQMPRSSGGVARRLLRLAPFARKGHSSLTGQLCRNKVRASVLTQRVRSTQTGGWLKCFF